MGNKVNKKISPLEFEEKMKDRGWKVPQLSKASTINKSTLYRFLNYGRSLSAENYNKLLTTFDLKDQSISPLSEMIALQKDIIDGLKRENAMLREKVYNPEKVKEWDKVDRRSGKDRRIYLVKKSNDKDKEDL